MLSGGTRAETFERRLRAQVYDIVSACGVGELFEWTEPRLAAIVEDELSSRSHEQFAVDPCSLQGGFVGDDFLPGSVRRFVGDNFGPVARDPVDSLLATHLARAKGVRKGTFGAFVANYRLARADPMNTQARETMAEYLFPDIMQLGYFDWLMCKDAWAQELVESARARWKVVNSATSRSMEKDFKLSAYVDARERKIEY